MKKIHTRTKRKLGLATKKRHYAFVHGTKRTKRPRTFSTEENAMIYAKTQGLKEGKFTIKRVKKDKRFQIVE